jgi:carboxyl-terminal processing protease
MNHDTSPAGNRSLQTFLLVVLAFLSGMAADRFGFTTRVSGPTPSELRETFTPFWETWALVQEHYVDRRAIQPKNMTEGAIQGMLASLGDVGHTTYLTPQEVKELEQGLKGKFEGIGAGVTMRDKLPTISHTMPGSPARKAGVKTGDIILDVNGKSVRGMSLTRVVQMVRGPAGTEVHLRLHRQGKAEPLDISIIRAKMDIPEVAWRILPDAPIAHLAIHEFGSNADDQLRTALAEARRKNVKGLIVDVRGNPGGLKDQAVAVTSQFLKDGIVFIERDATGKETAVPVKSGGLAPEIALCVLIDEGTASSAEIFAGAIQDYKRGKLVGTKTFGTGTVLQPFGLSDGSAVLLAVSEWLTPKGRQIWHQGIVADIEVDLPPKAEILFPDDETPLDTAALKKSTDKQLLKAIDVLKEQIKRPATASMPP